MPKINFFRRLLVRVQQGLSRLSFRTGLWVLALCVVCYVVSFAQAALPLSLGTKGVLWVVFFGLAKTFQYTALAILGKEGWQRVKHWWQRRKKG